MTTAITSFAHLAGLGGWVLTGLVFAALLVLRWLVMELLNNTDDRR